MDISEIPKTSDPNVELPKRTKIKIRKTLVILSVHIRKV